MKFQFPNLILVLFSALSSLTVALPATDSALQGASARDAESSVGISSGTSASLNLEIATEVQVERDDSPAEIIHSRPVTTLATVITPGVVTAVPAGRAKGPENSKNYSYYVLKCTIGATADECYRMFGTYCNTTTGQMVRQAPPISPSFDCMPDLWHCRCVNIIKEACIYNRSC